MSTLIETRQTTPSMVDFARTIRGLYSDLSKAACGVLWAHFAGETGDGVFCYNWNLGNVQHAKADGFDYATLRGVWEGFKVSDLDGDGDVDESDRAMLVEHLTSTGLWVVDTHPDHQAAVGPGKIAMMATRGNAASWFRAFPTLREGMRAFVDMKRAPGKRYSSAWPFVEAGDPEGYARELGEKGYYTASPDVYARSMRKKFDAWMASDAYEQASDTPSAPEPSTDAGPASPSTIPVPTTDPDGNGLVPVVLDGETWLVCPIVVAPIGIGEAAQLARSKGFELPTPALADAIWRAADLKVPPHLMVGGHDGVHMDTPELNAMKAKVLEGFLAGRSLGKDFKLLAGAYKDVVMIDGKPGLYGWHADKVAAARLGELAVPTHAPATPGKGVVIQPPFSGHALAYRDYSQAVRLVRRA